jgi:hypothetical protein
LKLLLLYYTQSQLNGFSITTNPLTAGEAPLQQFNVTKTDQNGDPFPEQPYTSGGYYDGLVFSNASSAVTPLDVPNNWVPSGNVNLQTTVSNTNAVDPISLVLPPAGSFQIVNDTVRFPLVGYDGAQFEFVNPQLATSLTSSILYLTTDDPHAGIIWAETQSPGEGAAGDVYGVKNKVPEPSALLGLLALSGMGFLRKTQKQK